MSGPDHNSASTSRLDLERRAFLDLLRMANTMANSKDIARQLVVVARHLSGCEAVAIRLKNGPGYPYAASLGFPEHFISLEDDLCAKDEEGHLLRGKHRQPVLACLVRPGPDRPGRPPAALLHGPGQLHHPFHQSAPGLPARPRMSGAHAQPVPCRWL